MEEAKYSRILFSVYAKSLVLLKFFIATNFHAEPNIESIQENQDSNSDPENDWLYLYLIAHRINAVYTGQTLSSVSKVTLDCKC